MNRILKAIITGIGAVAEILWSLFGLLGTAAFGYGWSQSGTIGGGIDYYVQEFTRFFGENQMNPILKTLGDGFAKYVEIFSKYPWAHLVVLFLGIMFILRKYRNVRRFVSAMNELIHSAEEPQTRTNLVGRVIPNVASGHAMAQANRKIGFERTTEGKTVDTTGMPSVLARHANWGKKS